MSDSSEAAAPAESYPRQSARTQRYTLGEPRDVVVSPDGRRIVFLRSRGPIDPSTACGSSTPPPARSAWSPTRTSCSGAATTPRLPPEERARRERAREAAAGITAYATDAQVTVTAFAIAGRLFVAGLLSGQARELPVAGPVFDPRPDPLARRVAYVSGRLLCIGELDGRWHVLAGGDPDEPETVTWGSADFIAAEEMDRFRGYWWSPDGDGSRRQPRGHRAGVTLARRRSGATGDVAGRARLPCRRHGQRRRHASPRRPRRHGRRRRVGPRPVPLPRRRPLDRRRPDHHRAAPRPARRRGARGRPGDRVHRAALGRHGRPVGRARARRSPSRARRRARSRAPTATAPAGCSSTASR